MAAPYARIMLRPSYELCAKLRSHMTVTTAAGTTFASVRTYGVILRKHSVERLSKTALIAAPRNRAVWGSGCRSVGRLSKRMPDYCERRPDAPRGAIFGFIAFVHPAPGTAAFECRCRRQQHVNKGKAPV